MGLCPLSFLSAWFADKSHADSCDGRRPFFADDFSAAEIILLAKYGQAKIAWSNFSVRCSHRFFRGHKSGSKNAVNFLDHDGPKKGCNPALRRSVLPLYVAKRCQRCKNVTLCQRVTETPAKSRL